tara:strand:+ start:555 stop:815 length:261 start_codon:yes stop_codon:yes gene_type:complete
MNLKISKNSILEGDLVMLNEEWMHGSKAGKNKVDTYIKDNPYIGIVTDVRAAAGMYDGYRYVKVLWENNTHKEHYIRDLVKVKYDS